jgi:hypothetical protein
MSVGALRRPRDRCKRFLLKEKNLAELKSLFGGVGFVFDARDLVAQDFCLKLKKRKGSFEPCKK